jgi:hypothetical protein
LGGVYQYSATFDALLRPTDLKVANAATILLSSPAASTGPEQRGQRRGGQPVL